MARTNSTNFTGANQYPMASAGTDIFKKEDVQTLAKSVDLHNHSAGLGLPVDTTAIPAGALNGSKLTDGTVTSAKIQDGTIVAADVADASLTNAKLGSDVARANLLTNGGFEIWQRGNGPFTANNAYAADRWQIVLIGNDTVSVTRAAGLGPGQYAASVTTTHGTGNVLLQQILRASDTGLLGQTVTFSVMVWSPNTAPIVAINRDGTGGGQVNGNTHTGGSTWQKLSVTAAIPADATSVTLFVAFNVSAGYLMDNAMLVVGSQAADYVPLHPADDLARCLRYYEVIASNSGVIATAQALSATQFQAMLRFRTYKAVTPTLTQGATQTLNAGGSPQAVTATSVIYADIYGCGYNNTVASGLVAGNATNWSLASSGQSIQAEANP